MPRRVSSPKLIGRGPELTALLGALESAAAGRFSGMFVAGESGVGKSRLLQEVEREAEDRGAQVLTGECVMLAAGELPYAPLRSALRQLGAALEPQAFDELLGSGREELARLLPALGGPAPPRPPPDDPLAQARLFELLLSVLTRLTGDGPVVLAIEDIHWADRSTLDFLAFLIANARRERLLLVCTYRTDELHVGHPLRAFLAQRERPPAVERIDLRSFTVAELDALLREILETAPDAGMVQRLHARTEGNPFFAEELLAADEEGIELPDSLRAALLLRIEVLSKPAQFVLRLAAAHGRVVTHRLLAGATGLDEEELHAALREAVTHHVLVRPDLETFAFRHALLAEALGSDLLPGERAALHLALARAIEADPTLVAPDGRAAAQLCRHWLGANRPPEALGAAVQAGIEAHQVYAFAEAGHHFERALELWPNVADAAERAGMPEAELYARAADASHLGDAGDTAIRLIREGIAKVDPNVDPYRSALLLERLGHYLWLFSGDDEGAQRAYEEAVDLLPADEPRLELARALATLGQILMLRGRTDESLARCEQAIAIARQTGARAEEAFARNALGGNLAFLGDRETGIVHLRESLRTTEELRDVDGMSRAYVNLGEVLDQDARFEDALQLALEGARRMRELGMRDASLLLESEAATRLVRLGRLDEAERLIERAAELPASLTKLALCAVRARLEIYRARVDEAERVLQAAEEAMPHAPATWIESRAKAWIEFELLRGDPDAAYRVGEEALARAGEHEHVVFTARLHALTARAGALVAERARAAGDEAAARDAAAGVNAVVARFDALLGRRQWRGPPPLEVLAHREVCAAEAARADGAGSARAWTAVAERWAAVGLPLEEAYARLREAESLALAGDRKAAEQTLGAALAITRACGALWLGEQLEALARRARLSPAGEAPAGVPVVSDAVERIGLTERERAVLELLAAGKTNREIGEELFMAQKTASVHVSRILSKLRVGSRVEAATAAQRLGIVR